MLPITLTFQLHLIICIFLSHLAVIEDCVLNLYTSQVIKIMIELLVKLCDLDISMQTYSADVINWKLELPKLCRNIEG